MISDLCFDLEKEILGQQGFREGERQEGLLRGRLVIELRGESGEDIAIKRKVIMVLLESQRGKGSKTRAFTLYIPNACVL